MRSGRNHSISDFQRDRDTQFHTAQFGDAFSREATTDAELGASVQEKVVTHPSRVAAAELLRETALFTGE